MRDYIIETINSDSCRALQISDTHLLTEPQQTLFDVNTYDNLQATVERISHTNAEYDFILLTGDVSQDETAESYQHVAALLAPLQKPIYWIPGNHDDPAIMAEVFDPAPHFKRVDCLDLANWRLIFLNSKIAGSNSGHLSPQEMEKLCFLIESCHETQAIAIVMHHPPVSVANPLIDKYMLTNQRQFFDAILPLTTGRHIVPPLIICGHVHSDHKVMREQMVIEMGPATAFSWEVGEELVIVHEIGYKQFTLQPQGYEAKATVWDAR